MFDALKRRVLLQILEDDVNSQTIFNGFITYYRFLFSVAIFGKGKSIDIPKLDEYKKLSSIKLLSLLANFDVFLTANYDWILEAIISKKVEHLHGKYYINEKRYVYHQSLILKSDGNEIECSDILLGDYFIFKTFIPIVNKLARKEGNNDILFENAIDIIKRVFSNNNFNLLVIFGLNVENDYHILRNIMLEFFFNKVKKPIIIYCYYNDNEVSEFENTYKKVITYNKEATEYCKNIERHFISSKDIIKEFF